MCQGYDTGFWVMTGQLQQSALGHFERHHSPVRGQPQLIVSVLHSLLLD